MKSILAYYLKGFSLLNKKLLLFFLGLLFIIGSSLNQYMIGNTPLVALASYLFLLLSAAFAFIPLLVFDDVLSGKKHTLKSIALLMKNNFLRSIRPILLLIFLYMVIFGTIYFFNRSNGLLPLYAVTLIFLLIEPFFRYFGIFYMLQRRSIWLSGLRSIAFAKHHLAFTFFPLPFLLLDTLVTSYKLINLDQNLLFKIAYTSLWYYVSLLITTSSLLYFKSKHR